MISRAELPVVLRAMISCIMKNTYAGSVLPKSWWMSKQAIDGVNSRSGRRGSFKGANCSSGMSTSDGTLHDISKERVDFRIVLSSNTVLKEGFVFRACKSTINNSVVKIASLYPISEGMDT